jgi:hypothetical protein
VFFFSIPGIGPQKNMADESNYSIEKRIVISKIKRWEDNPRTQRRLSDKIQQSRSSHNDHVKMGKEAF